MAPEEQTLMTKARQRERKRRRQAELNEAIRRGRQAELQKDEEVDRIFNMLLEARFGRKDRYQRCFAMIPVPFGVEKRSVFRVLAGHLGPRG